MEADVFRCRVCGEPIDGFTCEFTPEDSYRIKYALGDIANIKPIREYVRPCGHDR